MSRNLFSKKHPRMIVLSGTSVIHGTFFHVRISGDEK
jgi:hypothetical protein